MSRASWCCSKRRTAPHRIAALAETFGARAVTVARKLTKQFEQIATMPCADLPAWLAADPQRQRGEFVLILHPVPVEDGVVDAAQAEHILALHHR